MTNLLPKLIDIFNSPSFFIKQRNNWFFIIDSNETKQQIYFKKLTKERHIR